jgi:hypothetical protein
MPSGLELIPEIPEPDQRPYSHFIDPRTRDALTTILAELKDRAAAATEAGGDLSKVVLSDFETAACILAGELLKNPFRFRGDA